MVAHDQLRANCASLDLAGFGARRAPYQADRKGRDCHCDTSQKSFQCRGLHTIQVDQSHRVVYKCIVLEIASKEGRCCGKVL